MVDGRSGVTAFGGRIDRVSLEQIVQCVAKNAGAGELVGCFVVEPEKGLLSLIKWTVGVFSEFVVAVFEVSEGGAT